MKPIEKDELFAHLGQFLKNKGIELKEGSYTKGIQKGCGLLTDAINMSHKGVQRAKSEVDKKLEQLRQAIHEKSAPKRPTGAAPASQPKTNGAQNKAGKSAARKPKAKARKPNSGNAKG